MFSGRVDFVARVLDGRTTFQRTLITSSIKGVQSIELESQTADDVSGTVLIEEVTSEDAGLEQAKSAIAIALNRLSYFYDMVIEPQRITASNFSPLNPPAGHITLGTGRIAIVGHALRIMQGMHPTAVKLQLEELMPPGENNFALFRSARLSLGPVEEFMQLYSILLGLLGDKQSAVDEFIVLKEPGVIQAASPKGTGKLETTYTRLRNELAHKRAGSSIEATKADMSAYLSGLRIVVKAAIAEKS